MTLLSTAPLDADQILWGREGSRTGIQQTYSLEEGINASTGNLKVARGRMQSRLLDWRFRQSEPEPKEMDMDWNIVEGNWKQFKGKVKSQWGKLTDDHLDVIAGKRDQLLGKIQESYGITKDEAEKQIKDFEERSKDA